ncbi:hypothetical protein [Geochorda subterranea]|uniref:Uncharacterized protein n=1 Tax=Geochorda subterranea TaxID=3109564 RepID=A0ABZ1BTF1_9FIRM|nr:hypothetical protein [Limnochorda sp. LNt]WRP15740.1 hypothetical protein VLY81_06190 [Limnochorda sp. LNt]
MHGRLQALGDEGARRLGDGQITEERAVGLTLAATGLLPPALAAVAQSLPDLAILGTSSRLLRLGR